MADRDRPLTALITGASSGIGKAIACALAERGVALLLVGRDEQRLQATRDAAASHIPQVHAQIADLTDDRARDAIVTTLRETFERIDILVHSAGVITHDLMEEASIEEFDRHYATNVRAPYALTQSVLPDLVSSEGQVVFINSSIVAGAKAETGQYGATKYALKGVADSLRDEVNPQGVRVLSVYPGRTATPLQAQLFEEEGRTYRPDRLMQPEDVASVVVHALFMPRTAEMTDVWLRSMKKSY